MNLHQSNPSSTPHLQQQQLQILGIPSTSQSQQQQIFYQKTPNQAIQQSQQMLQKQFSSQNFHPYTSAQPKQQQNLIKQKNEGNLERTTPQVFQDASNLIHTHMAYSGNRTGTPNVVNQSPHLKWSPQKPMKAVCVSPPIQSENELQSNGYCQNRYQEQTPQKENAIQQIQLANVLNASSQNHMNQSKVGYHQKNFQSCGGINFNYFANTTNSVAASTQCQYPLQEGDGGMVKNSNTTRILNSGSSTNSFITSRKNSHHKQGQSMTTNTSFSTLNLNNTLNSINNNVNINNTFNNISNLSSPINNPLNSGNNLTNSNKSTQLQLQFANSPSNFLNNITSPLNQSGLVGYAQSTRASQMNTLQQQPKSINLISQSSRNVQFHHSKSVSNIQPISLKTNSPMMTNDYTSSSVNSQQYQQLSSQNINNTNQANLIKKSTNSSLERTRSLTPSNNVNQIEQANMTQSINTSLSNNNIKNKFMFTKKSSKAFSNIPFGVIDEENISGEFTSTSVAPPAQSPPMPGIFDVITQKNKSIFNIKKITENKIFEEDSEDYRITSSPLQKQQKQQQNYQEQFIQQQQQLLEKQPQQQIYQSYQNNLNHEQIDKQQQNKFLQTSDGCSSTAKLVYQQNNYSTESSSQSVTQSGNSSQHSQQYQIKQTNNLPQQKLQQKQLTSTKNEESFDSYCFHQKKFSAHDIGRVQSSITNINQSQQLQQPQKQQSCHNNKIFSQTQQLNNIIQPSNNSSTSLSKQQSQINLNTTNSNTNNNNFNSDQQILLNSYLKGNASCRNSNPSLLQSVNIQSNKSQQFNMTGQANDIFNSSQTVKNSQTDQRNINIKGLLNSQNNNNNNNQNTTMMNFNNMSILSSSNNANQISNNTSINNLYRNITPIACPNVKSKNDNLSQQIQTNTNSSTNNQSIIKQNNQNSNSTNFMNNASIINSTNNQYGNNQQSMNNTVSNLDQNNMSNNQNNNTLSSYGLLIPLAATLNQKQQQSMAHHSQTKSLQNLQQNNGVYSQQNPKLSNQLNDNYYNQSGLDMSGVLSPQAIQAAFNKLNKGQQQEQKIGPIDNTPGISCPATPHLSSYNFESMITAQLSQKTQQNVSQIQKDQQFQQILEEQQQKLKEQLLYNECQYQITTDQDYQTFQEMYKFPSGKQEKQQTTSTEKSIFLNHDITKCLKTETVTSQAHVQTQQINFKTDSSDSFQSYQKKRKYSVKDFEFIKQLGSGVFGQVHMVRDKKTKGIFALKLISKKLVKEREMEEQLQREFNIHSEYCKHFNILECLGYFEDEQYYYLLLEYATCGSVANLIDKQQLRRLSESESCQLIKQLLESIQYLHDNGIIHRDLKLENILISNGQVKLCDFGCSTFCDQPVYQRRRSFCGTLDYVSPEMIQNQIYDKEIDIWAVGVITFEICCGFTPFTQFDEKSTYKAIENVKIHYPRSMSEELKDFVKKIFVVDPRKRATATDLLNHDWILKFSQQPQQQNA